MSVPEQITALLAQATALGSSASLSIGDRARAQKAILTALAHFETPYEHLLRLSGSHLQLAAIRLGADVGMFKALVAAGDGSSLSVAALADKTGVAPELLGRVLRLLASVDMVAQPGPDSFTASPMTHELASQALESGVHLLFDIHDRTYQALPDFLASHTYKDVDDIRHGVFQAAFDTTASCYEYLAGAPQLQGYMQDAMKLQPPSGDWLSVFPLAADAKDADPQRPLLVDIGGGMGHQCMRFRERFAPDVAPGRVVLQDMAITIGRVPSPMPHGIEAMAHDIDDPQPIKNAKFYYTRNVLHGLPDDHSVLVLQQTRAAMAPDSRLIVDDIVVPDQGACTAACQLDFIMMASIAGKKRTRAQWYRLLERAGFRIVDIRSYSWPLEDSLIIAEPLPAAV